MMLFVYVCVVIVYSCCLLKIWEYLLPLVLISMDKYQSKSLAGASAKEMALVGCYNTHG